MTPADALLAACLADPDADLPRLALADALDDAGHDARAAFVRAQVALAAAPAWDPLAVLARHRRPDLRTGDPFHHTLPDTGSTYVEWAAEPFRRGLGWAVRVRQLSDLLAVGDELFARAPVGELVLPEAPRDHWLALCEAAWLPRVRAVRFDSLSLPVEPVQLLGDTPGGLTEVELRQASGPAAPGLVGELARSPLGRQLTALRLRGMRPAGLDELLDELDPHPFRLAELSLTLTGLTPGTARRLAAGPLLGGVRRLDLTDCQYLGDRGVRALLPAQGPARFEDLSLAGCGLGDGAVRWLGWAEPAGELRRLDLSRNPLAGDALEPLARESRPGLRALVLRQCGVGDAGVRHLVGAAFWPHLTELDLRFNGVGDAGARHLLQAAVPADLTALLLAGNPLGDRVKAKLRAKYGAVVLLDDD